jgi:putative tryptophan/tyrosine transport system substrate-binding protein
MDRRRFLLTSLAGALARPLSTGAQQAGKIYRIGTLHTTVPEDASERVTAFERSLAERGYFEGRNVAFVHRYSGPEVKRLGDLASDLVRAGVDVIVTSTNPSTVAAMKATTTVPIVMTIGVEPVAARLVKSITKPGGNVTGLTFDVDPEQLAAKRLEILKELVPSLVRVAVLWNPTYEPGTLRFKGTEEAGRKLGVAIVSLPLTDPDHVDRVFAEARRTRVEAITVLSDPVTFTRRAQILDRAVRHRLPAIYALREFVADGGLVSYATSLIGQYRRAALYVDKILKGAKPGDLPVEHPIAFELWINRKAARAIGLTIPPALLLRADQVIE